jgi:hypothetical protein
MIERWIRIWASEIGKLASYSLDGVATVKLLLLLYQTKSVTKLLPRLFYSLLWICRHYMMNISFMNKQDHLRANGWDWVLLHLDHQIDTLQGSAAWEPRRGPHSHSSQTQCGSTWTRVGWCMQWVSVNAGEALVLGQQRRTATRCHNQKVARFLGLHKFFFLYFAVYVWFTSSESDNKRGRNCRHLAYAWSPTNCLSSCIGASEVPHLLSYFMFSANEELIQLPKPFSFFKPMKWCKD